MKPGDDMTHTGGQGWNLVPIPKIVLAEEIFRTYYQDQRPGQLNAKELTVNLVEELLRYEVNDLSVGSVGFCLTDSGIVDWDFVAFARHLTDATTLEVHKRTLARCKEMPSLVFNAEFIAVVLQLHEDVLIDEFLGEGSG